MSEVSDNGYHCGNHGHDTNPETAHTKPAVFDSHFYIPDVAASAGNSAQRCLLAGGVLLVSLLSAGVGAERGIFSIDG